VTLAKVYKDNNNQYWTCQSTGPAHPNYFIFIYLLLEFPTVSLAGSSHRQRRRRWPMTTIPTRLARAATVSTSSVQQRKRVLDLYREWIRGVRSFFFFCVCQVSPFYPLVTFPTTHHRHPKFAHYIPSTFRRLQCALLFATALRRIATCPTRR
jgi:hypothetical protein